MRRTPTHALLIACLVLGTACGSGGDAATDADGTDSAAGSTTSSAEGGDADTPTADPLPDRALLMAPRDPEMNKTAPDVFRVKFTTTKGDFVIEVTREWAPLGADRFYNLTKAGYFDGIKFFRVINGFMVQFGIHGDPEISRWWSTNTLQDDPVKKSNLPGYITYAKTGAPHSRSTQLFINYGDNHRLDADGFAPFGQVVEGMSVVNSLHAGYDGAPSNYQTEITRQGNAFLDSKFPNLDSIVKARLVD